MTVPRVWPVAIVAGLGIALLVALGVWQLQRLSWKTELIATMTARAAADPVPLADALARAKAGEDVEFVKVTGTIQFDHVRTLYFLDTFDGKAAWRLVTPGKTGEGSAILIDRGIVPEDLRDAAKRPGSEPEGPIAITGQLAAPRLRKGLFTPDNDPSRNIWYWWDEPQVLAATGIDAHQPHNRFILHLTPGDTGRSWPRPQPLDANLRNNHLGYALTWFGLAIVLATVAVLRVRRRGHGA